MNHPEDIEKDIEVEINQNIEIEDQSTYGFKELIKDELVLKALEKLEYHEPTEVQALVIPYVQENQDLIVKSKTGSGKTASFGIPICEAITLEKKNPSVLILTPTRELAVQVREDMAYIGRFKKIRCAAVYGRQPIEIQRRELKQRVHVVVATPGRLIDHIEREHINLDEIQYLVIDEADELLNMGFIDQVEEIIKKLPEQRLTMLFSATMPDKVQRLCQRYMKTPITLDVANDEDDLAMITQSFYQVNDQEKIDLLEDVILEHRPKKCIIFCNTREKVDEIVDSMTYAPDNVIGLHGGMEQKDRLMTIQDFKKGKYRYLVATDVAARGIHIDDINLVINYELSYEKERYVHRIGRTARAGKKGRAISFVSQREMVRLLEVEDYIKASIKKELRLPKEAMDSHRLLYEAALLIQPKQKADRSEKLNHGITKIRINAGKKKKIRPGDILGALHSIEGIEAEDIGIIDIEPTCSYVEIFGRKGEDVYKALLETPIKGRLIGIKKVKIRNK